MGKPVVFIIGASGSVGSATVSTLSTKYGDRLEIRAGVRNPDKADNLKALANVTVVPAEMGSPNLESTLRGVEALFIVTPGPENRAELVDKTAQSAKAAGVKFILVVSIPSAMTNTTILGRQFNEIETKIKALGVPYCILRLPFFTENLLASQQTIKEEGRFSGGIRADVPLSAVVAVDSGRASAAVLSEFATGKHDGKTYTVVSFRVSHDQFAQAFSEALQKEVKYSQVPYDEAIAQYAAFGFPQWRLDAAKEMFDQANSGSASMDHTDLSDFEMITGEKSTSLKDFFSTFAKAFA